MLSVTRNGGLCSRLAATAAVLTQRAEVHHHKERHDIERFIGYRRAFNRKPNRHWDVKWRRERKNKFLNVSVPDVGRMRAGELSAHEQRAVMLQQGFRPADLQPDRPWNREREVYVETIGVVIDAFVPPSGETRHSILSKDALTDRGMSLWKSGTDIRHRRTLTKRYLPEWDRHDFAEEAEKLYVTAMEALCAGDEHRMHQLMTPLAFQKTMDFVGLGTLRWSLVERVSDPLVVRVRVADFPPKTGNDFAQVTVRMHNKQTLALYDQFGRLKMGSETAAVPVLEYLVFERHVAATHGRWRLLDMIVPEQHHQRAPVLATLRLQNVEDKLKQRMKQRQKTLGQIDHLFASARKSLTEPKAT